MRCWTCGAALVMAPGELTPTPVAPLEYTKAWPARSWGCLGRMTRGRARAGGADQQELKRLGKTYEFHMYPNAGHGFFYYDRPAYRPEQAVDGWKKFFCFSREVSGRLEQGETIMCTMIAEQIAVEGSGKGASGRFTRAGECVVHHRSMCRWTMRSISILSSEPGAGHTGGGRTQRGVVAGTGGDDPGGVKRAERGYFWRSRGGD